MTGVEVFWSHIERGISGTYIHFSEKHLWKYLGEFECRWNTRQVNPLVLDRLMRSFAGL